jgi:GntR family transcriptional repressor for pyruvate dehydrogenase complex
MLEPHAVAMAAMRMTDEQVEGLRAHLGKVGADSPADDLVANDLEFHRRIAEASGNSVLCSLLENLAGPTMRGRIWRGLTQEGAWGRTHAEHQAILDAIADRQPDVARGWATVHVAGVEQWLRRSLLDP